MGVEKQSIKTISKEDKKLDLLDKDFKTTDLKLFNQLKKDVEK